MADNDQTVIRSFDVWRAVSSVALAVVTQDCGSSRGSFAKDVCNLPGTNPAGCHHQEAPGIIQFPVKQTDLATILSHLKVEMKLERDTYTIDEFIAMARKHPDLVPVMVEKMRYGFAVDGIICEYAQVWLNGALVETTCCESENDAGMRKAVEALGIAARRSERRIADCGVKPFIGRYGLRRPIGQTSA